MTRMLNATTASSGLRTFARISANGSNSSIYHLLSTVLTVWEERRRLAALDDASLRDLGLTRADVARETSRSLLDIPANRL